MTPKPPRVEPMAAHPQQPTKHWQAVKDAEAETVTRTAEQRAARDRERHNHTEYARNERAQQTGD